MKTEGITPVQWQGWLHDDRTRRLMEFIDDAIEGEGRVRMIHLNEMSTAYPHREKDARDSHAAAMCSEARRAALQHLKETIVRACRPVRDEEV